MFFRDLFWAELLGMWSFQGKKKFWYKYHKILFLEVPNPSTHFGSLWLTSSPPPTMVQRGVFRMSAAVHWARVLVSPAGTVPFRPLARLQNFFAKSTVPVGCHVTINSIYGQYWDDKRCSSSMYRINRLRNGLVRIKHQPELCRCDIVDDTEYHAGVTLNFRGVYGSQR